MAEAMAIRSALSRQYRLESHPYKCAPTVKRLSSYHQQTTPKRDLSCSLRYRFSLFFVCVDQFHLHPPISKQES
ncbi:hypothetical protein Bca4012_056500 [Brassica carinata]